MKVVDAVVEAYTQYIWGDELVIRFSASESKAQSEGGFFVKDVSLLVCISLCTGADDYKYYAQKIQRRLNTSCVQQIANVIADLHARCKNLGGNVAGFTIDVTDYWKKGDVMALYIVIRDATQHVVYETVLIPTHIDFCSRIAAFASDRTGVSVSSFTNLFSRIYDRCKRLRVMYLVMQAHNKTRKEVQK